MNQFREEKDKGRQSRRGEARQSSGGIGRRELQAGQILLG